MKRALLLVLLDTGAAGCRTFNYTEGDIERERSRLRGAGPMLPEHDFDELQRREHRTPGE